MTDTELLEELHKAAADVSYYEAAEGEYHREKEQREAAKTKFWNLHAETVKRGLEVDLRGYLL